MPLSLCTYQTDRHNGYYHVFMAYNNFQRGHFCRQGGNFEASRPTKVSGDDILGTENACEPKVGRITGLKPATKELHRSHIPRTKSLLLWTVLHKPGTRYRGAAPEPYPKNQVPAALDCSSQAWNPLQRSCTRAISQEPSPCCCGPFFTSLEPATEELHPSHIPRTKSLLLWTVRTSSFSSSHSSS